MENWYKYYIKALQFLARSYGELESFELGQELFTEQSEDKLVRSVMKLKDEVGERAFYYNAGMADQYVSEIAKTKGRQEYLEAHNGLIEFNRVIGYPDNDEDEDESVWYEGYE